MCNNIICNTTRKAQCSWTGSTEQQILQELQRTWRAVDKYMKDAVQRRKKWLQELAENAAGLSANREKAINQIRHRKKARWIFHRICTTLHMLHSGGLAAVDVPIYDNGGTLQGWESITNPSCLHETVVERNCTHLQQAAPAPFGHGEGFNLLHGDNRHHIAEKILDNTLDGVATPHGRGQ